MDLKASVYNILKLKSSDIAQLPTNYQDPSKNITLFK